MKERIDLAPMLRETIRTPSNDLVTRSTGVSIRHKIVATIEASPFPTMHLDFGSIRLLDFSCADEIVAKLLLHDAGERPRYVVLVNLSEGHREAIDHVLEAHDLAVAAVPTGQEGPCVLGARSPDLLAAFEAVQRLGAGEAGRLADDLGWTLERAADALQSLALRRLVQAASGTFCCLPVA